MTEAEKDLGVLTVLVERLEKERLPRAMEIRDSVASGNKLSDFDLKYLEQVLSDGKQIAPYLERNPEYLKLAASVTALYKEITDLALQNETAE